MNNEFTHRSIAMPEIRGIMSKETGLKGKNILEIGQGTDKDFRNLFEELGLIYTGSDHINFFSEPEYHTNKMEDLKDFKEGEFDYVFSCHAFEHCEQPITALREAKRVLKNGGKLIMITPWCCKHHIIDADSDHIFVLNAYQLIRLLYYTGFVASVMEQKPMSIREQDFNIIVVAEKNEL